jgi:hypothetical protein
MDRSAIGVANRQYARNINQKGRGIAGAWMLIKNSRMLAIPNKEICVISEGNHSPILGASAPRRENEAQESLDRNVVSSIEEFVQANR